MANYSANYCTKCGTELNENAQVCPICGGEAKRKRSPYAGFDSKFGDHNKDDSHSEDGAANANEQRVDSSYSDGVVANEGRQRANGISYFDGGVLGWIGHSILFSLCCLIPLAGLAIGICVMGKWIASHTYINGRQLVFAGTAGELLGSVIIWELLTMVTLSIYGFWVPVKICRWVASNLTFAN